MRACIVRSATRTEVASSAASDRSGSSCSTLVRPVAWVWAIATASARRRARSASSAAIARWVSANRATSPATDVESVSRVSVAVCAMPQLSRGVPTLVRLLSRSDGISVDNSIATVQLPRCAGKVPRPPAKDKGRPDESDRPLHLCTKRVLQSHVGCCHSKTASVRALYNGEITNRKRFSLCFCNQFGAARVAGVRRARDPSVGGVEARASLLICAHG